MSEVYEEVMRIINAMEEHKGDLVKAAREAGCKVCVFLVSGAYVDFVTCMEEDCEQYDEDRRCCGLKK